MTSGYTFTRAIGLPLEERVMQLVGRPEIAEIGAEVRKRLERVLAAV